MQLNFHREFAAPARVAWAYLSEPERMNLWSRAPVRMRAAGQNNHPAGPGAQRRVVVTALGRKVVLEEVIRDARPGEYLRYEVVEARGLKSHTGQIFLEDKDDTCAMHWQVDFEFSPKPANQLVARVLRRQLEASLDALQEILKTARRDLEMPQWAAVAPPSSEDWQRAEQSLVAQRTLARELSARNDPKNVFAHVYSNVTEDIIAGCKRNTFVYPAWALKLLPSFHSYYLRNYERWIGHQPGPVESHWRRAFQVTDHGSSRYPGRNGQVFSGLILSIHAHIASDLPRSLAEVYANSFADTSDYARFRGDYYAMGKLFQGESATKKVAAHVPPDLLPRWATLVQGVISDDLLQQLIYWQTYDVLKDRRGAFRAGAEIADLLVRRDQARSSSS